MKQEHVFNFTVAYADTDAEGIMYHARYIEVAERARFDWSKDVAIPDGDTGFVARELNIKYMRPLLLGDNFIVETRTVKIGAASMVIEQKFVKDNNICAIMNITVAYLGGDMRPKQMPASLVKAFE